MDELSQFRARKKIVTKEILNYFVNHPLSGVKVEGAPNAYNSQDFCSLEPFQVDEGTIKTQAEKDGYLLLDARESLPDDLKITKVCRYWPGLWIEFLHRKLWKKNPTKEFHRHRDDDLPAFYSEESISWHQDGEFSRGNNLPTKISQVEIIYATAGKWHRTDGPAKISVFFPDSYYLNHQRLDDEHQINKENSSAT